MSGSPGFSNANANRFCSWTLVTLTWYMQCTLYSAMYGFQIVVRGVEDPWLCQWGWHDMMPNLHSASSEQ